MNLDVGIPFINGVLNILAEIPICGPFTEQIKLVIFINLAKSFCQYPPPPTTTPNIVGNNSVHAQPLPPPFQHLFGWEIVFYGFLFSYFRRQHASVDWPVGHRQIGRRALLISPNGDE